MAERCLMSRVRSAYQIATEENGYAFDDMSDEQVAIDMTSYDSDLEMEELSDVQECVTQLRKEISGWSISE